MIQYVFDDESVAALFARSTRPSIWVRSTCTLTRQRENGVDRDGYASCYRTVPETHALIARHFDVTAVDRVYPDELESAYRHQTVLFRSAPASPDHANGSHPTIAIAAGARLLSDAAPAAAYIDPGTGSALFYVITGIVVAIYFGVRGLYYRAIDFVFRIRHRDQRCDGGAALRGSALRDHVSCR